MAKCTSPLRRYGDLLVHWQIEAALLEEARTQKSLIGNKDDSFLPFSKAALDAILPVLDAREREIRRSKYDSTQHWLCHYLVRAWRFQQAELPKMFTFVVRRTFAHFRSVKGFIVEFGADAELVLPEEMDFEDVIPGERYVAKLVDVNVYRRSITVEAVRRIEPGDAALESVTLDDTPKIVASEANDPSHTAGRLSKDTGETVSGISGPEAIISEAASVAQCFRGC